MFLKVFGASRRSSGVGVMLAFGLPGQPSA
jgi:hypothetical protein